MSRWWIVLAVWWLGAVPAHAQSLDWHTRPDTPRVGDRITAELVLTHPAGTTVDWGADSPRFDGAEADPQVTEQTVADGAGNLTSRRIYTLYADLPGSVTLPRVSAAVIGPDGGRRTVSTNALTLTVTGAFDPEDPPPLAPAKGPLELPVTWWPYLAGAVLALALLVWLLRRWLRGRKPVPQTAPVVTAPAVPPHRAALARLDALDPALPPRAFFGELSDIARHYLAGRYGIPAPHMTSTEVARAVRQRADLAPVGDWLSEWDLVKFARFQPPGDAARDALKRVRQWVMDSIEEREAAP